ncbi:MAG: DNA alkylation repair protein [bacterium]|nr:DNA alkylation repair protein [bacterium]
MTNGGDSPARLAAETLDLLRSHADEVKAASYQRWFKEPVNYFGLDSKTVKRIKQDIYTKVEEVWTIRDAVLFCNMMIQDPHMEARGIGYQVVAHFVSTAETDLLAETRHWLEEACGNWGLVDNLAPSVIAPLIELHPHLISEVVSWVSSPNLWLRRGAVVTFVPLVGKGADYQAAAYRIAGLLFGDTEDLIHKAVGWLLREAGKTDPDRLRAFLLDNGPEIPRTTVRYAIERFPKVERKHLLVETRGKT